MSTKDPLVSHDDFQVYRDYFDDGFVWLSLRKVEFEATSSEVRVKIPVAQWEVLRRAPGGDFDMLDVTDDQIVAQVQTAVDERLRDYDVGRRTGGSRVAALFGALVFGPIEDSRERQIAKGVAHYMELRAQQHRTGKQIAELEQQTKFTLSTAQFIHAQQLEEDEDKGEAVELHEIVARVLGSSESVVRWMMTPALALDGARPGDLLATAAGRERVRNHLARVGRGGCT